jgi:hypothetical protein
MNSETLTAQSFLSQIQASVAAKSLKVSVDPDHGVLLIRNIRLGKGFNRSWARLLIRFSGEDNRPRIYVRSRLELIKDGGVCDHFIGHDESAIGWNPLCPYMFPEIGDEFLEFVTCLIGLLAMPSLCGLLGCGERDRTPVEAKSSAS